VHAANACCCGREHRLQQQMHVYSTVPPTSCVQRCTLFPPPPCTPQELKSWLVAEPVVVRVLEQSLGHPTMVELRLMALDVAEFLSRAKCDRPPLQRLIPTAARWAANPAKPARAVGPIMTQLLRPGQSMEQAIQTTALSLLTNLLDRWAAGRAATLGVGCPMLPGAC